MRSLALAIILVVAAAQPARAGTLDGYHRLVDQLQLSRTDTTVAFAVFMVGCYVGYTNAEVPRDEQVGALITLLRPHAETMFAQAGTSRQQVFEYMATHGTTFLVKRAQLAKLPDARAKAALRAQVERVLATAKIDPKTLVEGMGTLLDSNDVRFPKLPIPGEPTDEPAEREPTEEFPKMEMPEEPAQYGASSKQVVGVLSWFQRRFDGEYFSYNEISYLLLKSGWAGSPDAALDPDGLEANRAKNPKHWVKWRKVGSKYQVDRGKGWGTVNADIGSPMLSPMLPKGFRFAGGYKSTSGGSVGDTHSLRYKFWRFEANGRFSTSGAATVTSKNSVGGRTSKEVGGTYEIDGVVLTLRYDDGSVKHATIVTEKVARPKSVTINGTMFH